MLQIQVFDLSNLYNKGLNQGIVYARSDIELLYMNILQFSRQIKQISNEVVLLGDLSTKGERISNVDEAHKCTTATIHECHGSEEGFDKYWSHSSGVPFLIFSILIAALVSGMASMS